jgi:hypothetical protein
LNVICGYQATGTWQNARIFAPNQDKITQTGCKSVVVRWGVPGVGAPFVSSTSRFFAQFGGCKTAHFVFKPALLAKLSQVGRHL